MTPHVAPWGRFPICPRHELMKTLARHVGQVVNLRPIGNRPPRVGTAPLGRRQGIFNGGISVSHG
jgi:hypothetical protein